MAAGSAGVAAWAWLALAILLEVAGTAMLKLADGFQRPGWFVGALVVYCLCFAVLTHVFTRLPLPVAYAVWGGVGAVLIVFLDILLFSETLSVLQAGFVALIILGVVGLKLTT